MDVKKMAECKKAGRYQEIVDWAETVSIDGLDDAEKVFFVAEAYEKVGNAEKCIAAYEKGMREFLDETVPEPLFIIYRQLNKADELVSMADFLEEEGFGDEYVPLCRFEVLRIRKAPISEQIQSLKDYLDEYDNEIYFVLLLEYLLESADLEQAKRYLNRYHRLFISCSYEAHLAQIEQVVESGNAVAVSDSIRKVIYARTLVTPESVQKTISQSMGQNVQAAPNPTVPQISGVGVAKKKVTLPTSKKEQPKTRIKTKTLVEALGSMMEGPKKRVQNQNPPSIDERFEDIVGMQDIRDKLGNVYRAFRSQQLRQSMDFYSDLVSSTHFAVSGKPGCGKTMLAETIGQLLMDFGIRGTEEAVTIEAKDFLENYDQLARLKDVTLIIEDIDRCKDQSGKFGDVAWKLCKFMKDNKEEISVILTGSREAVLQLFEEETEIRRLIYTELAIGEYSAEELGDIFEKIAYRQKWILTEDAKTLARKQLAKEKNMSTFECGKSMIEKIKEAAKRAADRMDSMDDPTDEDMVTLEAEDFQNSNVKVNVPELLEKLDNMTGLAGVKEQVNKIVSKLVTAKKAEESGSARAMTNESLHMVFKGAPGTGKTTVARIISEIYMALGVLPGNEEGLVEVAEEDLVSEYVGQTKGKTMAVVNRAMGGVLFIDEAYTLTKNQHGHEAIEALLKVMEDSRDSIMIILAGYEKEMDKFLDVNPGLRSRIPTQVLFEDYTEEELVSIFKSMVKADKRLLDRDTGDSIAELIGTASKTQDFGNARGVRNLVGQVEAALDERLFNMVASGIVPSTNDYEIIRKEDIEAVMNHATDGSKTLEELLEDLDNLEGMTELKEIVRSNVNRVRAAQKKKELGLEVNDEIDNLHMVFSGGPGTGKTTTARKIGYIYKALGILPRGDSVIECSRPELVADVVGGTAPMVKEQIKHSLGGVLFIDEAYTLSRDKNDTYGREAIDTLVADMENLRGQFMMILAGYTDEMNTFLDRNPGLRSRIAHNVEFEDFSLPQMVSIFEKFATKSGYVIEDAAKPLVEKLLKEKSQVKDFGNARGVRNVWKSVITAVDGRIITMGDSVTEEDCRTVKREDILSLIDSDEVKNEKTVDELLADLDAMIGLASVKSKVHEIVVQAKFNQMAKERGLADMGGTGSLHLLFKGNAGTGKTTVAQMLGQIYKQLGVLRTGECHTCTRVDLVAEVVGGTAPKTQEVIDRAMGGILFVDEAYTLAQGSKNDFGQEALTTIMTNMENHRDDLMVIFAGYPKEIDELIDTNPGLESRFPKQNEIIFEDYSDEELLKIFLYQAKKNGMVVGEELYPDISAVIAKEKKAARSFGNARAIRNIVEAVNTRRKGRIMNLVAAGTELSNEDFVKIAREDIGTPKQKEEPELKNTKPADTNKGDANKGDTNKE